MAFMKPVYVQGVFGRIEDKHGETRLVPIEYAELEDGETCEEVAGWVCQLSANGYMDQTDWDGPSKLNRRRATISPAPMT